MINLVGLTVSLAFVIIIFSYAVGQFNVVKSVPDCENVYAVCYDGRTLLNYGIADRLKTLPESREVTRFSAVMDNNIAEYKSSKYNIKHMVADKEFFDMFNIEMISGTPERILEKSAVFLSESFAGRIANDEELIGKEIMVLNEPCVIAGIYKDFGEGLLPYTDIIGNWDSHLFQMYALRPFTVFGAILTFVKTVPGTNEELLEEKINGLFKDFSYIEGSLSLVRADKLYFDTANVQLNIGNMKLIRNMFLAGLALLLSALFNYINLNTALVGKRANEMGTRRLLGSDKRNIVWRYIAESGLFTAVCFVFAVLLAVVLLPVVGALIADPESVSSTTDITMKALFSPAVMCSYIGFAVLIAVVSGIVPAVIASRISPIDIVKGQMRVKSKMVFSKIFIICQNVISVVLIAVAITMETQMRYMLDRPTGCDYTDIYYLDTDLNGDVGNVFLDRLKELPCVNKVGVCDGIPGAINVTFMHSDEESDSENKKTYYIMRCDTVLFNMLGFDIQQQLEPMAPGSLWLSESAMKLSGINALDRNVGDLFNAYADEFGGYGNSLCGVVSDFVIKDAGVSEKDEGGGVISIVDDSEIDWKKYVIHTVGDHAEAQKAISQAYDDYCKEVYGVCIQPIESNYMVDYLANCLEKAKRNMRLIELFMIVAVILSLSGLVAISIYYADSHVKSIALHKVYGGTIGSETLRNLKLYFLMTLIADIVAVPVAIILCNRYLQEFAYRIEPYCWIFVITVLLSVVISLLSVIWQVGSAARTNPAIALKKE